MDIFIFFKSIEFQLRQKNARLAWTGLNYFPVKCANFLPELCLFVNWRPIVERRGSQGHVRLDVCRGSRGGRCWSQAGQGASTNCGNFHSQAITPHCFVRSQVPYTAPCFTLDIHCWPALQQAWCRSSVLRAHNVHWEHPPIVRKPRLVLLVRIDKNSRHSNPPSVTLLLLDSMSSST